MYIYIIYVYGVSYVCVYIHQVIPKEQVPVAWSVRSSQGGGHPNVGSFMIHTGDTLTASKGLAGSHSFDTKSIGTVVVVHPYCRSQRLACSFCSGVRLWMTTKVQQGIRPPTLDLGSLVNQSSLESSRNLADRKAPKVL